MCLYNVDILEEKFLKSLGDNKKYIVKKDEFEILRWPFVTFEVILDFINKMCVLNVSISRNFYQKENPGVSELPRFRFVLARCRRTYVLNKYCLRSECLQFRITKSFIITVLIFISYS